MSSSRRHPSGNRQQQILDTTLDLVASQGLLNTSISKISKQAKASPGIVYHYFTSKDEIMHTLYENIFGEMIAHLSDALILEQVCLERYKNLWLKMYYFHLKNPSKTIFIEQYKNSSYYTETQESVTLKLMAGLVSMVQNDINAGLVIDLPIDTIYAITLNVAANLAKSHIHTARPLDEATLTCIAERVCSSILL